LKKFFDFFKLQRGAYIEEPFFFAICILLLVPFYYLLRRILFFKKISTFFEKAIDISKKKSII